MAVDDTWYLKKRGPDDERLPSKAHGVGKRWRVRYTDDAGQGQSRYFERAKDAERFDASVRTAVDSGQYIDDRKGKTRFREYAELWRASQVHAPSTRDLVENRFRLHVYPVIGERPLSAIRPSEIQAMVSRMGLAPATVESTYRFVSSVFSSAVADRLIAHTPCMPGRIKLPKAEKRPRITPLPTEAVDLWADVIDPRHRFLIELASGSGMRGGEMMGLEVDRINVFAKTVRVDQQLVLLTGQPPFLDLPKGGKRRTIPVGQFVLDALRRHMTEYPPTEVEIVDRTRGRDVTRTAKLVFVTARSNPMRRNVVAQDYVTPSLKRVCATLLGANDSVARQLSAALRAERNGLHLLRHYFASLLIFAGASVVEVQEALGHATATETLETYAGLWPSSPDRIRNAVDTVRLGASSPVGDRSLRLVT